MSSVSGNRPQPMDHLAKAPSQPRDVGMAMVRTVNITATCSCGASKTHGREKVREDWIDSHLDKKHGGQGIRF